MLVLARLGLDPWDVLHRGLSRTFGLAIGTRAFLISFVVLLGWWPLRTRPGIGTVANAIVVGAVIDMVPSLFGPPHAISARYALLVGGVVGNGFAAGLYIGAGLDLAHETASAPRSPPTATQCASCAPPSRPAC
jgi:uncharacterized membrane protein YczE